MRIRFLILVLLSINFVQCKKNDKGLKTRKVAGKKARHKTKDNKKAKVIRNVLEAEAVQHGGHDPEKKEFMQMFERAREILKDVLEREEAEQVGFYESFYYFVLSLMSKKRHKLKYPRRREETMKCGRRSGNYCWTASLPQNRSQLEMRQILFMLGPTRAGIKI